MGKIKRIYVEKKEKFGVKADELREELRNYLAIKGLEKVRILIRYDIENLNEDTFEKAKVTVFSEPPVDILYEETFPKDSKDQVFTVEYLPGQFDQRADSATQCVKLLNENENPTIHVATTYVLSGDISNEDYENIVHYCVNPVDSRVALEEKPDSIQISFEEPKDVEILHGFILMTDEEIRDLYESLNLAMTIQDFFHVKKYFIEEKRDPAMTEIRVLDTYWSDHCRHTTFLTELKDIDIEDGYYKEPILAAYEQYLSHREEIYKGRKDKYISLMDMATLAMKKLRADGKLQDMEESEEINACSIIVPVEINGEIQEWLILFKNETHNHPTEIEPFGGAATCLGGAIRDPLSGRGYVYQAMRVTGAADPRTSLEDTLKGKLPQRKIVTTAADGYSSYGNQIGLATGLVDEIYHPNYVAKRMEIGAVIGAVPRKNVMRKSSNPGDIIILIGGQTGRDGIGGATGSSKVHTTDSIDECGAEVQKGNPPTERKLQRLFRREEVSRLIKKCNDFGAGGVSVAIGELADGLLIDLDKVPKKYAGLDGTELAISESQERMAVVVDKKDAQKILDYSKEENLEATIVATVTEEPRLVMTWRNKEIVNLSREFLDTNGAHQEANAIVTMPDEKNSFFKNSFYNTQKNNDEDNLIQESKNNYAHVGDKWMEVLKNLNVTSKKGLVEMFDSSIGAGTVTMPYGGKYQLTPIQTMISKLPVLEGNSDTVTMMSYGFDPYLSTWSPFHGATYGILSSVAKIVASGGNFRTIRFTFQEYFKRLHNDKKRWGEPLSALLGAYDAQIKLGLPSIGGKDSMSGTFNDIDVPPTLVSFAVNINKLDYVISPELKKPGNVLIQFDIKKDKYDLPDYEQVTTLYDQIFKLSKDRVIESSYAIGSYGLVEGISKMAFGNKLGVVLDENLEEARLFNPQYGSIIAEIKEEDLSILDKESISYTYVGKVIKEPYFQYGNNKILIEDALTSWTSTLEDVFPTYTKKDMTVINSAIYDIRKQDTKVYINKNKIAKPKVFIPVFPGTNCEYDSTKAFENAGAEVEMKIFKNLTGEHIRESIKIYEKAIQKSQVLMFPGGFSAGDEPDGSGKFIATVFRNERIKAAVEDLLNNRDGLILGICNGFQALIKLGLVPFGKITPQEIDSPTLIQNNIGRHISKSVYTKVVSNKSPWLQKATLGGIYAIPASHGEGRFMASEEWINRIEKNGQIATQYVDLKGNPTMDEDYNPNGSLYAIEGITSPDGRVLGKMAHSERIGKGVAINIYGEQDQMIFESGVEYFR